MGQYLPYKDTQLKNDVSLYEIFYADNCAETGYFVELDLQYPNEIKGKVPLFPINEKANITLFTEYMNFI